MRAATGRSHSSRAMPCDDPRAIRSARLPFRPPHFCKPTRPAALSWPRTSTCAASCPSATSRPRSRRALKACLALSGTQSIGRHPGQASPEEREARLEGSERRAGIHMWTPPGMQYSTDDASSARRCRRAAKLSSAIDERTVYLVARRRRPRHSRTPMNTLGLLAGDLPYRATGDY
jgi:hypothetical protein